MKIAFSYHHVSRLSWLITFFTRNKNIKSAPVSHAFPILGTLNGIDIGLSADDIMVNLVHVDRYRNRKEYFIKVYEIPDRVFPEEWAKAVIQKYNQKFYGWFDLPFFIYRWFRRLFDSNWSGRGWFNQGLVCSEVTALAMIKGGYLRELGGLDVNIIDAIELEAIVKQLPDCRLIETTFPEGTK